MRGSEVSLLSPHSRTLCPRLLLSKILPDNPDKSWEPFKLHSIVNIEDKIVKVISAVQDIDLIK